MSRDSRDLGELGETVLRLWASQVGLTANPSTKDQTGWDFILEFPEVTQNHASNLPFDKSPSAIQCRVQVKSTDTHRGNRKISLSNWKRMIDGPLPYFILALEFDGKTECQRAYLVHIDEAYIRKVLKRLRELSDKDTQLHKRSMMYDYSPEHALTCLNGEALAEKIMEYVGESMEAYAHKKIRLRQTFGYENGSHQLRGVVTFPETHQGMSFEQVMVDLELGILPHLEMTEVEIRDNRFGIPLQEPEEVFPSGKLTTDKPKSVAECSIQFSTPDLKHMFRIKAHCYVAMTPDKAYGKIMVKSKFLSVLFEIEGENEPPSDTKRAEFSLSVSTMDEAHPLTDLKEYADTVSFLQDRVSARQPVNAQIFIKRPDDLSETLLVSGTTTPEIAFGERMLEEVKWITFIEHIAEHFGVRDRIEFSLSELISIEMKWLELIDNLIKSKPFWTRIQIWFEKKLSSLNALALNFVFFDLGQYRFVFCIGHFGDLKLVYGPNEIQASPRFTYTLETKDQRLVRSFCVGRGELVPHTFVEVYQAISEDHPDLEKIVINTEPPDFFKESGSS